MKITLKLVRNEFWKINHLLIAFICILSPIQALANDTACMAVAIHKEASGEGLFGEKAVLDVIQQRMKEKHKTACQVIKEPGQFSWSTENISPTKKQLTRYKFVASIPPVVKGARYFHNTSVSPKWARKMKVKAKIGRHYFY